MNTIVSVLTIMFDPMLLAIAVIYTYGFVSRLCPTKTIRHIIMGTTFGFGAIFAMMTPMVFAEGVIVDLRSLLVGLSAAFFGPIGAVISATMGIVTRIYLGGAGTMAGTLGVSIAACMGLSWAYLVRHKLNKRTLENLILGSLISLHLCSILALPTEMIWRVLIEITPILFILNIVGAILIGGLLGREEALIAESDALLNAAKTDPLTRLHNRRSAVSAYEDLPETLVVDHATAMLCFDVDNFKSVNDTYGHVIGDVVLSEISKRIGGILRPNDIFSRLGGDEFLIILPSVTHAETEAIAERCRDIIAQNAVAHDGQAVNVTISVGAEWMPDRPDFITFVARADEALYQAKRLGRNCVAFAWDNASRAAQALSATPAERTA